MPVMEVVKNGKVVGYRYGQTGKVYKNRADAEKQGAAIRASQARERRKK